MTAYNLRLQLEAVAQVYLSTSFNIDQLFYNQLILSIPQFMSYFFVDLFFVYQNGLAITTTTAFPLDYYSGFDICWAYGYNYNSLTAAIETTFKYPSCYKKVIQSL